VRRNKPKPYSLDNSHRKISVEISQTLFSRFQVGWERGRKVACHPEYLLGGFILQRLPTKAQMYVANPDHALSQPAGHCASPALKDGQKACPCLHQIVSDAQARVVIQVTAG